MTIRPQMLAFLIAASGTVLAADTPKEIPADKFEISKVEKEVLDLTNAERAKESLPPFKPHPLLFQAAREHSKNMAKQEKMEHVLDGIKPHERTKKVGYKSPPRNINSRRANPAIRKGAKSAKTSTMFGLSWRTS